METTGAALVKGIEVEEVVERLDAASTPTTW
jgi:hypothetical protein